MRLDVLDRVATAVLILDGKLDRLEAGLQDYFAWIPEVVRATARLSSRLVRMYSPYTRSATDAKLETW